MRCRSAVLQVIFATETLAAGINMPARTTVISVMSRRRGGSITLLTHNELLQMAGRAGDRAAVIIIVSLCACLRCSTAATTD